MYWGNGESRGTCDYSKINVSIVPEENYKFLEKDCLGYYGNIFLAVNMIFLISPIFPSTLVPFSESICNSKGHSKAWPFAIYCGVPGPSRLSVLY